MVNHYKHKGRIESEADNIPEAVFVGSIGSTSPEFATFILECEKEIIKTTAEMQGWVLLIDEDTGKAVTRRLDEDDRLGFSLKCISWHQSKLRGILNKNTILSTIMTEQRCDELIFSVCKLYSMELLEKWKEFEIDETKFSFLNESHYKFCHFAFYRAFNKGDREFLSKTTSETTSRVDQRISEQQEKKGGVLGFLR
jgi:hypothetical protein